MGIRRYKRGAAGRYGKLDDNSALRRLIRQMLAGGGALPPTSLTTVQVEDVLTDSYPGSAGFAGDIFRASETGGNQLTPVTGDIGFRGEANGSVFFQIKEPEGVTDDTLYAAQFPLAAPTATWTGEPFHLALSENPDGLGGAIWRGVWSAGTLYPQHSICRDGEWLSIANKDTTERSGVTSTGESIIPYDGTITRNIVQAKGIYAGQRYTINNDGYIVRFAVEHSTGVHYDVYYVSNSTTHPEYNKIGEFDGTFDGWSWFNIEPTIFLAGTTFDLVTYATVEDPVPVTFVAAYEYLTPNNEAIPADGTIVQPDKLSSSMRVANVDADDNDIGAQLAALVTGDTIAFGGHVWTIGATTVETGYVDFTVLPVTQGATGDYDVTFTTSTTQDIMLSRDDSTDYWDSSPYASQVSGLYGADIESYSDITVDRNAYGTNIDAQLANIPVDWDIMATSSPAAGAGANDTEHELHGWQFVTDGQYTSASPLVADGARVKILIDGLGPTNEDGYMPSKSTENFWDTVANKFNPQFLGDAYNFRLTWKARGNKQGARYDASLAFSNGTIPAFKRSMRIDKGIGIEVYEFLSCSTFTLQEFLDTGGEFFIDSTESTDTIEVYDIGLYIQRTYSAG